MTPSPATVSERAAEAVSPSGASSPRPAVTAVGPLPGGAFGESSSSPLLLGGGTTTRTATTTTGLSSDSSVGTRRSAHPTAAGVGTTTTTTARHSPTDWASRSPLHGRGSISASSVAAAGVTGTLTQTESAAATTVPYPSSSSYDNFKLGLIVTLSVVIGCFAITAISLRIRSRIKKRRLESETLKKKKKCTGSNGKPPVKRATVRTRANVPPKDRAAPGRPLQRSHSPSLQSRARVPKVQFMDNMDRNRTLDALLLDAGVYPTIRSPAGPPMGPFSGHERTGSDASSRAELIPRAGRARCGPAEHAYANPVVSPAEEDGGSLMSGDGPGGTNLSVLGTTLRIQAEVHRNKGALSRQTHPTTIASDSDDGSAAECKGHHCACVENSETESLVDARRRFKLGQYQGLRSNQRNGSKDSGYVESFISQDSLRLRAMTSVEENRPLPVRGGLYAVAPGSGGGGGGGGGRTLVPAGCRGANPEDPPVTHHHLALNRSSSVKSETDGCVRQRVWLDGVAEAARRPRLSVPAFPTHPNHYHQQQQHQQQHQMQLSAAQWHQQCQSSSVAAVQGPYYELQPLGMARYPSSEGSAHELVTFPHHQTGVVAWAQHRKISQDLGRRSPQSPRFESASDHRAGPMTARVPRGGPARRFVKQRSLGTQTGEEEDGCGAPAAVCWSYNSAGQLVALPLEGADMDYIGPVYMAEELDTMITCLPDTDCVIEMNSFT